VAHRAGRRGICCSGSGWWSEQCARRELSRFSTPPSSWLFEVFEQGVGRPLRHASTVRSHQTRLDFQADAGEKAADLTHSAQGRSLGAGPRLERPASRLARPAQLPCAGTWAPSQSSVGWFPPRSRRAADRTRPGPPAGLSRKRRVGEPPPHPGRAYKQITVVASRLARVALQQLMAGPGRIRSRAKHQQNSSSHRASPTAWLIARATARAAGWHRCAASPRSAAKGGESCWNSAR